LRSESEAEGFANAGTVVEVEIEEVLVANIHENKGELLVEVEEAEETSNAPNNVVAVEDDPSNSDKAEEKAPKAAVEIEEVVPPSFCSEKIWVFLTLRSDTASVNSIPRHISFLKLSSYASIGRRTDT